MRHGIVFAAVSGRTRPWQALPCGSGRRFGNSTNWQLNQKEWTCFV
jgi:hypothetical protein